EQWKQFLGEERKRGFDLKQAPLMRLALMRTGEESYYFAWNSHHILLDGWCRQIVMGEVLQLYEAHSRGEQVKLKAPRRYRDYIAWRQRQDGKKAEECWRGGIKALATATQ